MDKYVHSSIQVNTQMDDLLSETMSHLEELKNVQDSITKLNKILGTMKINMRINMGTISYYLPSVKGIKLPPLSENLDDIEEVKTKAQMILKAEWPENPPQNVGSILDNGLGSLRQQIEKYDELAAVVVQIRETNLFFKYAINRQINRLVNLNIGIELPKLEENTNINLDEITNLLSKVTNLPIPQIKVPEIQSLIPSPMAGGVYQMKYMKYKAKYLESKNM